MLIFLLLVVAIVFAQLVAAGLALVIMFNPKVMNWYFNKTMKMMGNLDFYNPIVPDEDEES